MAPRTLSDRSLQTENLFNVSGLVAVITGGGAGFGALMALALAENGEQKVYIIGRREEPLKELAAKYPGYDPFPSHVYAIVGLIANTQCSNAAQSCPSNVMSHVKPTLTPAQHKYEMKWAISMS